MIKVINWKKGMRLTDSVLKESDSLHLDMLKLAVSAAFPGRSGLLVSEKAFSVSVNFHENVLEVESLACLALTGAGEVIDIDFDSSYDSPFNTVLSIPEESVGPLLLTVEPSASEWQELGDGTMTPKYLFRLAPEDSRLPVNSFPIARIVNEYGWRLDDIDFVPPCLYVQAHENYRNLTARFSVILRNTDAELIRSLESECKVAVGTFWTEVRRLMTTMEQEVGEMSPMTLLACIQKYVSAFFCGCVMDPNVEVNNADEYDQYVRIPYSVKNLYHNVVRGVELAEGILEKTAGFKEYVQRVVSVEAPTIAQSQLVKKCTNAKVRIPIENHCPGAVVYYTTDGTEPGTSSLSGDSVMIVTGFSGGRGKEEADRLVTVKVKALLNGAASHTNTYTVRLQKDIKHWIEI